MIQKDEKALGIAMDSSRRQMSLIPEVSSNQESAFKLSGLSENVIVEALKYLPEARRFSRREDYARHLIETIPTLKKTTREGYAHLIVRRYLETDQNTDPSQSSLSRFVEALGDTSFTRRVMSLHYLKAEPLAAGFVEDVLYPRLPEGKISWFVIRSYVGYKRDEKDDVSAGRLKRALRRFEIVQKSGWGLLAKELLVDPDLLIYALLHEFGERWILKEEEIASSRSRKWLLLTDAELTRGLMALWKEGIVDYAESQIVLSKPMNEIVESVLKKKKNCVQKESQE